MGILGREGFRASCPAWENCWSPSALEQDPARPSCSVSAECSTVREASRLYESREEVQGTHAGPGERLRCRAREMLNAAHRDHSRIKSAFVTMEGTLSRRIRAPCLTEVVESSPPRIVAFLRDQDITVAQVNQRDHLRTRIRRLPCRGSHFHLLLRLAHGREVNQKLIGTDRNSTQVRRISTFEESSAIYRIDPALVAPLLRVEPACNPSSMPWSRKTERQSWPIHRRGRHATGTSRWPVRPPKVANKVSYKDHRDCRESKRKFFRSCHMTGSEAKYFQVKRLLGNPQRRG